MINNPNKRPNINTRAILIFGLLWPLLFFGFSFVKSLELLQGESQFTLKFFISLIAAIINGNMFRITLACLIFLIFKSVFSIGKPNPIQVGDQSKQI